jgi:UDP-glucose 4-epimerase
MKPALLITGANGFVGQALCLEAADEGFPVITLTRKPLKSSNFLESIVLDDFSKSDSIRSNLEKVQVVIHLAARVHVMNEFTDYPLNEYRKVNVENTLAIAKAAATSGVKRFIYLSSVKVNGEETFLGKPFAADDVPAPQDPYGISKLEAETALLSLGKQTGMDVVIIRPPLVYGPGVGANFAAMMRGVLLGIPLPLGSISNQRSMVALGNLIDLILLCTTHPAAANQVFLVSDGDDISLPQLLRKMATALGAPSRIFPFPISLIWLGSKLLGRQNVAQRLCSSLQLDIAKTKELLGWIPPVSVDQGLLEAAQWYLSSKVGGGSKAIRK